MEFKSFEDFYAEIGSPPPGTTLDRIDNDGNYAPGNVHWVSQREQMNNVRHNHRLTHKGKTQTIAQWARETGLRVNTIRDRIRIGHSGESLLRPVNYLAKSIRWQGETKTIAEWITGSRSKQMIQELMKTNATVQFSEA